MLCGGFDHDYFELPILGTASLSLAVVGCVALRSRISARSPLDKSQETFCF